MLNVGFAYWAYRHSVQIKAALLNMCKAKAAVIKSTYSLSGHCLRACAVR